MAPTLPNRIAYSIIPRPFGGSPTLNNQPANTNGIINIPLNTATTNNSNIKTQIVQQQQQQPPPQRANPNHLVPTIVPPYNIVTNPMLTYPNMVIQAPPPPMINVFNQTFDNYPPYDGYANTVNDPRASLPVNHMEYIHKLLSIENLSIEELQNRKAYVLQHPLLPVMMSLLSESTKNEGKDLNVYKCAMMGDIDLIGSIKAQGVESDILRAAERNRNGEELTDQCPETIEFITKINQLTELFKSEIAKIDTVSNEFSNRLVQTLKEHSKIRPVSEGEYNLRLSNITQRFDYIRNQLRMNVSEAARVLHNHLVEAKRKRLNVVNKHESV